MPSRWARFLEKPMEPPLFCYSDSALSKVLMLRLRGQAVENPLNQSSFSLVPREAHPCASDERTQQMRFALETL